MWEAKWRVVVSCLSEILTARSQVLSLLDLLVQSVWWCHAWARSGPLPGVLSFLALLVRKYKYWSRRIRLGVWPSFECEVWTVSNVNTPFSLDMSRLSSIKCKTSELNKSQTSWTLPLSEWQDVHDSSILRRFQVQDVYESTNRAHRVWEKFYLQ